MKHVCLKILKRWSEFMIYLFPKQKTLEVGLHQISNILFTFFFFTFVHWHIICPHPHRPTFKPWARLLIRNKTLIFDYCYTSYNNWYIYFRLPQALNVCTRTTVFILYNRYAYIAYLRYYYIIVAVTGRWPHAFPAAVVYIITYNNVRVM